MENILDIIDRIKKLKGVSKDAEVAAFLDITKENLYNYKARNRVPIHAVKEFCLRENLSLEYVLYGTGNPYLTRPDKHGKVDSAVGLSAAFEAELEFVSIPQVSGRISAGASLAPENDVDVRVAFRKAWIMKKGSPDKMSLIKVKGDSMEPTLLSGDMILVDHSKNFIDPQGGIYAIVIDDMIMLKRLQVLGQGRIRVVSDNPRYESIEVHADALAINGKVLWYCRDLER